MKIDASSVEWATNAAKDAADDYIEKALFYSTDVHKKERLKVSKCKFCYYFRQGRIGGASVTQQPCGLCNEVQSYGSTATDPLCLKCASTNELCKQCGGDLHMRVRRVFKQPLTRNYKVTVEERKQRDQDFAKALEDENEAYFSKE